MTNLDETTRYSPHTLKKTKSKMGIAVECGNESSFHINRCSSPKDR
jgi:hypothetical protein